jgi:hypothetical protein
MSDVNKIYYPETVDMKVLPYIPEPDPEDLLIDEPKMSINPPSTRVDLQFPTRRIAVETISQSINTKTKRILGEYEFGEVGALAIGKYVNGVSGDVRITPNGITARNLNGTTTFSIDGTSGDAVFAGTIQAGSVIADVVTVGDNSVIIDGANKRIVINDGTYDIIEIGYRAGGY